MRRTIPVRTAILQVEMLEERLALSANSLPDSIILSQPDSPNSEAMAVDLPLAYNTGDDHANLAGSNATRLSLNTNGSASYSGILETTGDRDLFQVQVNQTGVLTTTLEKAGSNVDTYLRIYNSAHTLIAFNDDFGGSLNSQVSTTVQSGTYYISAGSYRDRSTGAFRGTVQLAGANDDHVNVVGSDATRISLNGQGNGNASGELEVIGDRDVFRFDVASSGRTVILLEHDGSNVNTYLRLYDANGRLIHSDNDNGPGRDSRIARNLDAGSYYLSAGSHRDQGTGGYTISIVAPAGLTDDHVNAPGNDATVIELDENGNGNGSGVLEVAGDRDVFQINIGASGRTVILLEHDGSNVNTYLRLYDANGQLVHFDNDNGPGRDSRIAKNLEAGLYYLSAGSHRDEGTGGYTITIDGPAADLGAPSEPPPSNDPSPSNPPADPPAPQSEFDIVIRYTDNNITASQRAIFEEATQRWSEVIIGDLYAVQADVGLVDDIVIDASAPSIDGVGNILGQAGPQLVRGDSFLPIRGIMQFDSADIANLEANGQLLDVIIHEMGHVLGIGTVWGLQGLISGAGTSNPTFRGQNAMRVYAEMFGFSSPTPVPLANTGSAGTRDSHWRESVFNHEIMTGYLDHGINPLSRLTIAALQDMGYQVNPNAADPYTPPGGFASSNSGSSSGSSSGAALHLDDGHSHDDGHDNGCCCPNCQGHAHLSTTPIEIWTPETTAGQSVVSESRISAIQSPELSDGFWALTDLNLETESPVVTSTDPFSPVNVDRETEIELTQIDESELPSLLDSVFSLSESEENNETDSLFEDEHMFAL